MTTCGTSKSTAYDPHSQTDCPRCYGAGHFPASRVGFLEQVEQCACPAGIEQAQRFGLEPGLLLGGNAHEQRFLLAEGRVALMDAGSIEDVRLLWKAGIWTWTACEGGATEPGRWARRHVGLLDPVRAHEAAGMLPWVAEITFFSPDIKHASEEVVLGRTHFKCTTEDEALRVSGSKATLYGSDTR